MKNNGEKKDTRTIFLNNIPNPVHAAFKSKCYANDRHMRDVLILMMAAYAEGRFTPVLEEQKNIQRN